MNMFYIKHLNNI